MEIAYQVLLSGCQVGGLLNLFHTETITMWSTSNDIFQVLNNKLIALVDPPSQPLNLMPEEWASLSEQIE